MKLVRVSLPFQVLSPRSSHHGVRVQVHVGLPTVPSFEKEIKELEGCRHFHVNVITAEGDLISHHAEGALIHQAEGIRIHHQAEDSDGGDHIRALVLVHPDVTGEGAIALTVPALATLDIIVAIRAEGAIVVSRATQIGRAGRHGVGIDLDVVVLIVHQGLWIWDLGTPSTASSRQPNCRYDSSFCSPT
jgi:hypothetical protein